jgi:hypothetical protein
MNRTLLCLALLLVAIAGFAQTTPAASSDKTAATTPNYEQQFAPGGHLTLELTAGGYTIRGTDANKIRVFVTAKDPNKIKEVKFSTATAGANGKLKISGPHNDIEYVVELPSRLDVTIRLSAGDLEVRGLSGSKDISMHAGDLNLYVRPDDYANVDLSVNVGDLNAGPWAVSKGGFVRSFHQAQAGKYKLRAHVGAGDLNVVRD